MNLKQNIKMRIKMKKKSETTTKPKGNNGYKKLKEEYILLQSDYSNLQRQTQKILEDRDSLECEAKRLRTEILTLCKRNKTINTQEERIAMLWSFIIGKSSVEERETLLATIESSIS